MAQKLQRSMSQHAHDNDQIDHKHQDDRNHRRLHERIRVPDRLISRQAVTVVIHADHHVFEHGITQNISDDCRQKCHDYRHRQVMAHQLATRVTRCAERTDRRRFF